MRGVRCWATLVVLVVALASLCLTVVAALPVAPAGAFEGWDHDGATGCSCHLQVKPTDATCAECHRGFVSLGDDTCWTCHYPGQDTSSLSDPSSACAQECHLFDDSTKAYDEPFAHGDNPHLGSLPQCLGCHSTSTNIFDPGSSPHHNGGSAGMAPCSSCHKQTEHVGKVACISCHANANAFHTFQAASPGYTQCTGCHAKRHAGRAVPQKKCATCHKGSGTGATAPAQHSTTVTRQRTCNQSGCHSKQLHATGYGSGIRNCQRCHTGRYHAAQRAPGNSVCLSCHRSASWHTGRYACSLCHRSQIHKTRPDLPRIRG